MGTYRGRPVSRAESTLWRFLGRVDGGKKPQTAASFRVRGGLAGRRGSRGGGLRGEDGEGWRLDSRNFGPFGPWRSLTLLGVSANKRLAPRRIAGVFQLALLACSAGAAVTCSEGPVVPELASMTSDDGKERERGKDLGTNTFEAPFSHESVRIVASTSRPGVSSLGAVAAVGGK